MWGPNDEVFYLSSVPQDNLPFWHLPASLHTKSKHVYTPPGNIIQCAGSFAKNKYFGSASIKTRPQTPEDQIIFTCNNDFKSDFLYFQPSKAITKPNNFFSLKKISGRMRIPFRDPHLMPNGKIAVVTGGNRWGCKHGNICEVELDAGHLKITRETILEDSMLRFPEIERPTFIEDWLFFSPNYTNSVNIHAGKLGKNALYSYHGIVQNSRGMYGPAINSNFQMLTWNKRDFTINIPKKINISFANNNWTLNQQ